MSLPTNSLGLVVGNDKPVATWLAHYDNQDRLMAFGDTTYTYTVTGNLQTQTQGGQTTRYTYDTLSNLTKVELPNGTVVEYLIDGNDRRVGRKIDGNVIQQWLYRPLDPDC
ncbi:MAG: hypothetical protein BWK78_09450 [Thiotrichaceae bacterium IS1]|nr:MAG: hypothetical protein BWK78_09450 [Thiotrichaceae bacterium IS1]